MESVFVNVMSLGNAHIGRDALKNLRKEAISEEQFRKVLFQPRQPDIPSGQNIVHREGDGLRIVILLKPTPYLGSAEITMIHRIEQ
jgi:hypothetical protein